MKATRSGARDRLLPEVQVRTRDISSLSLLWLGLLLSGPPGIAILNRNVATAHLVRRVRHAVLLWSRKDELSRSDVKTQLNRRRMSGCAGRLRGICFRVNQANL